MIFKSKYKNEKTFIGKKSFASKKEAKRFGELRLLEISGKIENLECQKPFVLQEKFRDRDGKIQREIKYIADFVYWDCDKKTKICEDVKGFRTDIYRLKKKLFMKKFGLEYWFIEI
jgi:hypothetical protein